MMKSRASFSCLALLALAAFASAAPPEFSHGAKASVLIFTTTDCPIANAMLPEVARLQQEFAAQGISFTLVHIDPDTTMAKAREHAKSYGISVPFVLDPRHELVKRCQATRTPETFVILPDGTTAYHGRIDNLYHAPGQRRRTPSSHDLRDALNAVVSSRLVANAYQPSVGCVIADFAK